MAELHIVHEQKPHLNHCSIEYIKNPNGKQGYWWDIITGCHHHETGVCQGFKCWAKKDITGRVKQFYPYGFDPTIWPDRFLLPLKIKKPSSFAVCFRGDLGGEWINPTNYDTSVTMPNGQQLINCHLSSVLFYLMSFCPQHTFFFLTKNPSAWQKWGTWPDNAFVGATVDDWDAFHHNVNKLCFTKAKNKWLSLEPCPPPLGDKADRQLLGKILKAAGINWIVIGGYSGGKRLPPMQALIDVVNIADSAGIPIWIKDNLRGYDVETMIKPLRHQFPEVLSDSCNWDDPTMMMMNNFSLNL